MISIFINVDMMTGRVPRGKGATPTSKVSAEAAPSGGEGTGNLASTQRRPPRQVSRTWASGIRAMRSPSAAHSGFH